MLNIRYLNSPVCRINDIVDHEVDSSKDKDNDTLFIVPEASKASIERAVFAKVSEGGKSAFAVGKDTVTSGIFKYDVLSFVKFAQRIVQSSGDESITKFDEVLLRNVIYHIFAKHKSEFKNLNKYVRKFEYIDMLIDLLGDFTRYGVTTDSLDEVLNNAAQSEVFYDKISDLKLLIGYISEINNEYGFSLLDSDLGRASAFIGQVLRDPSLLKRRLYSYLRRLKDTNIVVYGFGSSRAFTPQELEFIRSLDELGTNITIYVLYDPDNEEEDLYYFGKTTLDNLRNRHMSFNLESFKAAAQKESSFTKTALAYAYDKKISVEDDGSVELLRMTDIDDELSYVCNEIIDLTRNQGYRYKDIRIFSPDDDVTERFKGIMRLFGLDAFVDKRVVLENTPVMRYAEALLELPLYNYPLETVLKLLNSGLMHVDQNLIDYFENFCYRENIMFGDRIFDENRYKGEIGSDVESDDEDIYVRPNFKIYVFDKVVENGGAYLWKALVQKVLIPIKEIADKIYCSEVMSEKARLLLSHMDTLRSDIEYRRDEFVDRGDTALASILIRSYTEIMTLLTSFTEPLNDVAITPDLFASLVSIDMRNKVIATIPLTVDSIEITDVDSASYTPCKVLFVIGAKSSNFPHRSQNDGIMSNNELLRLNSEISIELPDKLRTKSREEFVRSALILNTATDKIIMINKDPDFRSEVFRFFGEAFGDGFEKIMEFETPVYGKAVKKRHDIATCNIDPKIMDEFLEGYASVSVSSIEAYSKCPLNFMLNGVLKIRPREDGRNVQFSEVGTIAHAMFENAIKDITAECTDIDKLREYRGRLDDADYLEELSSKYFKVALDSSELPDKLSYMYSLNPGLKVRRIFTKALPVIIDGCVESGYIPTGFEQKLKDLDKKLVFKTDRDIEFRFNGSIDRVDTNPETGNVRIVDYKTGEKKVDPKALSAGLQIQLFAYALAMRNQGSKVDEVGYTEINLKPTTGYGDKDKVGTTFEYKSSDFTEEEMQGAMDAVELFLKKSCNDIANGKACGIVNSQSKANACKYCTYKGLCGNDPGRLYIDKTDYEPEEMLPEFKNGRSYTPKYFISKLAKRGEN